MHVDVELTPDGITGSVDDGSGEVRRFHGWLELSALLDPPTAPSVPSPESESSS